MVNDYKMEILRAEEDEDGVLIYFKNYGHLLYHQVILGFLVYHVNCDVLSHIDLPTDICSKLCWNGIEFEFYHDCMLGNYILVSLEYADELEKLANKLAELFNDELSNNKKYDYTVHNSAPLCNKPVYIRRADPFNNAVVLFFENMNYLSAHEIILDVFKNDLNCEVIDYSKDEPFEIRCELRWNGIRISLNYHYAVGNIILTVSECEPTDEIEQLAIQAADIVNKKLGLAQE